MDTPVQTKRKALSLIEEHRDKVKALGVKKLGLFGSFAREEQGMASDIDLLVEFERGKKTFDNFTAFLLFRRFVQKTCGVGNARVSQSLHWSPYYE